jgi:hypothetical protein
VSSQSSPTARTPAGDDRGPGLGFYGRLAGLILVAGLVAAVLMLVLFRAIYAFGLLGGFVAFALLLLGTGWALDRRKASKGGAS